MGISFLTERAEIFDGTQIKTIIYRLVVRNHDFDAYNKYIFGGKISVTTMLARKGLGS